MMNNKHCISGLAPVHRPCITPGPAYLLDLCCVSALWPYKKHGALKRANINKD